MYLLFAYALHVWWSEHEARAFRYTKETPRLSRKNLGARAQTIPHI